MWRNLCTHPKCHTQQRFSFCFVLFCLFLSGDWVQRSYFIFCNELLRLHACNCICFEVWPLLSFSKDSNLRPSTGTCIGSHRLLAGLPKINFVIEGKISKLCSQKVIKSKSLESDWVLAYVIHCEPGTNWVLGFSLNFSPCPLFCHFHDTVI